MYAHTNVRASTHEHTYTRANMPDPLYPLQLSAAFLLNLNRVALQTMVCCLSLRMILRSTWLPDISYDTISFQEFRTDWLAEVRSSECNGNPPRSSCRAHGTFAHIHTQTQVQAHKYTYMKRMHTHIYTCMHVHVDVHARIHTHMHMHIHIHMHMHIHIHTHAPPCPLYWACRSGCPSCRS